MDDRRVIITIGREFGSGGRVIGRSLSELLGISYYDKELLTLASRASGLCPTIFERSDERALDRLAHTFSRGLSYIGMYTPPELDILSNEGLFKIQSDAILKLGSEESCIIVGRCADYILRDHPCCLTFFIHSPLSFRISQIIDRQGLTSDAARDLILRTDKSRATYYDYFTNKTWGRSSSYDLSIDSSVLGIDGTVQFLKSYIDLVLSDHHPSSAA